MKICIVGLGSIGLRHLRNLVWLLDIKKLPYQIHALRASNRSLEKEYTDLLSRQVTSEEELDDDYDIALITNPTVLHYKTLQTMLPKSQAIFIEKPIFETSQYQVQELPWKSDGIYYVACPLQHTKIFSHISELAASNEIYCARALCSSYLPEWRRADYRTTYSAHSDLGGGVSIDLVHEWDYLSKLFGTPKNVFHMKGHYSHLEIDSDDLSVYLARYPDKIVEVHLDYFGRAKRRQLELYTKTDVIIADFYEGAVRRLKEGTCELFSEDVNDYYLREMQFFLDLCVDSHHENPNPPQRAYETLKIALGESF